MLMFHGTAYVWQSTSRSSLQYQASSWVLRLLFLSQAELIKVGCEDVQNSNTGFQLLTSSKVSTLEDLNSHYTFAGPFQSCVS